MTMNVNRFKIRHDIYAANTTNSIDIPINMGFQLVDQEDIIKSKLINIEVNKSINPILDYEKSRFIPRIGGINADNITYKLNFLNDSNQFNQNTYYSDLGFNDIDVKLRKKSFTNSFLFLTFYDTDITMTQKVLFFITIYPKITSNNFLTGGNGFNWGQITPTNALKVEFNLGNTLRNRNLDGQGFFIYYYKDEVTTEIPKNLYMRATFLNSKNGKTTSFMSNNSTNLQISELIRTTEGTTLKNNMFTKYILKNDNGLFFYEIDTSYSNNINIVNNNNYLVNLYETIVI